MRCASGGGLFDGGDCRDENVALCAQGLDVRRVVALFAEQAPQMTDVHIDDGQ